MGRSWPYNAQAHLRNQLMQLRSRCNSADRTDRCSARQTSGKLAFLSRQLHTRVRKCEVAIFIASPGKCGVGLFTMA